MSTLDGIAALRQYMAQVVNQAGYCAREVWKAYGSPYSSRTYATAMDIYAVTKDRHLGDRNPPAGFPVWLGPRAGSAAGDVGIATGEGELCRWSDYPGWGVMGTATIAQREAQTGREYLAWTGDFMGYTVTGGTTAAGNGAILPAPPTKEDDEMKYSGIYFPRAGVKGTYVYALVCLGSGAYSEWSDVDAGYNNAIAAAFGTGPFAKVTEGHAANIAASCAAVRKGV